MTEVARSPSVTVSSRKHSSAAMDAAAGGEMDEGDTFLNNNAPSTSTSGPQHARISEPASRNNANSENEQRFSPKEEKSESAAAAAAAAAATVIDGHAALVMEGRPGNPDPDDMNIVSEEQVKVPPPVPGLVMPAAIRISPKPPKQQQPTAAAPAVQQVLRPLPLKSDEAVVGLAFAPKHQQAGAGARVPPLPEQQQSTNQRNNNDEALRQAVEQRRMNDEARMRREAQIEFPNMPGGGTGRAAEQRPPAQAIDGGERQPPPTRHVQYANDSSQPSERHGHSHHHPRRSSQGRSHSATSSGAGSFGRSRPARGHSGSSGMGDSGDEHPHTAPLTPLFQRIVTDDVQLSQKLSRLIDKQNTKVKQLEEQHKSMQESLHREMERRVGLEKTLAEHEMEWSERCMRLEKERDDWEQAVNEEKQKNKGLQAVISRKELDIQRILQKKKDEMQSVRHVRGGPMAMTERLSHSPLTLQGSSSKSSSPRGTDHRKPHYMSPQHYLSSSGPVEEVRARNVSNSLSEFFGM